jgi:hypothetical protein
MLNVNDKKSFVGERAWIRDSKSLKGNLEELRYVFTSDELRKKLNVFYLHLEHQQRLGV